MESQKPTSNFQSNPKKCQRRRRAEFASHTTLHGVPHWIDESNSKTRRSMYFFVWLLFTGIMACQLQWNLHEYLKYETKVSMDIKLANSLDFPSVTICPESVYKKSGIGGSKYALKEIKRFWPLVSARTSHGIDQCYDPSQSNPFPNSEVYLDKAVNYTDWEKIVLGINDMFLDCHFQSKQLNCKEILVVHPTSDAYMCYTFNYANPVNYSAYTRGNQTRRIKGSGPYNSLQLLLSIVKNETCFLMSGTTSGFYLSIHDQNTIPLFFRDTAIHLSPGTRTEVSLLQKVIDGSATESLGRCVTDYPLYLFPNVSYVQDNCILQCLAEEIYLNCNCIMTSLTISFETMAQLLKEHLPQRQIRQPEELSCVFEKEHECLMQYFNDFKTSGMTKCNEKCPNACQRKQYSLQVSTAQFPADGVIYEFMNSTNFTSVQELRENLLQVDIFFQSMNYELVTETRAMTLGDVLSNVGGTLGLYLGASFISLIELFEFLTLWFMKK